MTPETGHKNTSPHQNFLLWKHARCWAHHHGNPRHYALCCGSRWLSHSLCGRCLGEIQLFIKVCLNTLPFSLTVEAMDRGWSPMQHVHLVAIAPCLECQL